MSLLESGGAGLRDRLDERCVISFASAVSGDAQPVHTERHFSTMLRVRAPKNDDWQQIDWLASNEVQEGDHSQYEAHWTRRRREFDGEKYESIVMRGDQVVAFCRLEKDPQHEGLRAFVVLDWSAGDDEVQDAAANQLEALIRQSGSSRVWMRELEDDRNLLEFMTQNGFRVEKRYELDGDRFVNLASRRLGGRGSSDSL